MSIEQFKDIWSGVALKVSRVEIKEPEDTSQAQSEDSVSEYIPIPEKEPLTSDEPVERESHIDLNLSEEESVDMGLSSSEANTEDDSDVPIPIFLEEQSEDTENSETDDESFEQIQTVNEDDVLFEQSETVIPIESFLELKVFTIEQNPSVENKPLIKTDVQPIAGDMIMLQPTTGETVSGTEVLNKEVIPDTYPVGDVRTTDKETGEQNLFSTTIQLVENIQASQYGQLKETELESIRGRLSPLIVIGAIKAAKIIGTAIIATPAVVNKTVPGVKVTTKKTTEIVQRAMSQAELTATQKNRVASRWAKRDTLCQQCYKF